MDVFVGVDVGTSGLKVAAVSDAGDVVAEAEAAYRVESPQPGWAETDPAAWDAALRDATAAVVPQLGAARIGAVAVDGQMHGLVLCGHDLRPVRPALLWPDRRAGRELDRWRALPDGVRAALANPLVAGMTGPLLSWVAHHEPRSIARARVALLPKDHVRCQLAPAPVTERSDASATLLWDVPADAWAWSGVEALGLPGQLLPDVVGSDEVVGTTGWFAGSVAGVGAAAVSGMAGAAGRADVPVVAGAADTPAALLAAGGLAGGTVQINLGTGAQVLHHLDRAVARADPPTHTYADADGGWYAMAAIQNAGLALDHARRLLGLEWTALFADAEAAPAGAGGVSFLPFLSGERGGVAPATSRGGWVGIDLATGRAELARAAVEAMVFTVRRGVELLDVQPDHVRLTGGGGRHRLVRQLLADALQRPVARVELRSASAIGAALLAARGVGVTIRPTVAPPDVVEPRSNAPLADAYERWLDRVPLSMA